MILSIITPSYKPDPGHLEEAYASIREQEMPPGWEWEWVIQEDGQTGEVQRILPKDPRVRFSTGRRGGVSLTRNMALARSAGTLVKNMDQDDILTQGALSRDIVTLMRNPDVQWVTSRVLDLLPDGSTMGFDNDPEPGELRPGYVFSHWISHNYRLPVHPTTICIRRDFAIAMGGWMAVPGSDDTGLLVPASMISTGWFNTEVGLLYRKWPGQASAAPEHTAPEERDIRMGLIRERAEALSRMWHSAERGAA